MNSNDDNRRLGGNFADHQLDLLLLCAVDTALEIGLSRGQDWSDIMGNSYTLSSQITSLIIPIHDSLNN